jgi:hypothetical protein
VNVAHAVRRVRSYFRLLREDRAKTEVDPVRYVEAVYCPNCSRPLRCVRGSANETIVVCPIWDYGVIVLEDCRDVRSVNSMIEAYPDVRGEMVF